MADSVKQNLTKELTTNIPAWAKGVFWIALIGGGGYLVYRIVKGGKGLIVKIKDDAQLKEEIAKDKASGGGLSYGAAIYTQLANQLFAALDGYWSEDEPAFLPVFKQIKTRADLAELIRVYGTRDVSPYYPAMTLNEAITRFFDETEKQDYIFAPLNANGVNYAGLI
jgi:hypothetical protein